MMMDDKTQRMLQRLSDRLAALLKPDPDWAATADQIEGMLDGVDLQVEVDKTHGPRAFATSLFLNNPRLVVLAERAIKFRTDPYQIDQPLDLIENLLPSNQHHD